MESGAELQAKNPGKYFFMGDDPRLPKMPAKPTLIDFFNHRLPRPTICCKARPCAQGRPRREDVLACLLHDIAVASFIHCDHGYWGAQLIEPYVDEEVSWAIRVHQALRFFPDESVGYKYPDMYVKNFGAGLRARRLHRGRVQARPESQVVHDCAPDYRQRHLLLRPQRDGELDDFIDIVGRNFKQPKEGLASTTARLAHVAHADVADAVLVIVRARSRASQRRVGISIAHEVRASASRETRRASAERTPSSSPPRVNRTHLARVARSSGTPEWPRATPSRPARPAARPCPSARSRSR